MKNNKTKRGSGGRRFFLFGFLILVMDFYNGLDNFKKL